MMRSDALNSHVYPLWTAMTAMKQIQILHVCSTDENDLKYFLVDETPTHIYIVTVLG